MLRSGLRSLRTATARILLTLGLLVLCLTGCGPDINKIPIDFQGLDELLEDMSCGGERWERRRFTVKTPEILGEQNWSNITFKLYEQDQAASSGDSPKAAELAKRTDWWENDDWLGQIDVTLDELRNGLTIVGEIECGPCEDGKCGFGARLISINGRVINDPSSDDGWTDDYDTDGVRELFGYLVVTKVHKNGSTTVVSRNFSDRVDLVCKCEDE